MRSFSGPSDQYAPSPPDSYSRLRRSDQYDDSSRSPVQRDVGRPPLGGDRDYTRLPPSSDYSRSAAPSDRDYSRSGASNDYPGDYARLPLSDRLVPLPDRLATSPPAEDRAELVVITDLLVSPGREKRPPKLVIILRGPPGSGKTYVSKLIRVRTDFI